MSGSGAGQVKIAPSILSADFGRLAEEVRAVEEAGADWIHVDVMDGHFVPNISLGPGVTRAVRDATTLPVDVHLMIESPERYLEAFRDAGADRITVHQETCAHLHRTVEQIRELGARPGVTINPATPVRVLVEVIPVVDLVLIMSVNPGFGGQSYIARSTEKIRKARYLLDRRGNGAVDLQVDGGVHAGNAGEVVEAGASVLVAGSAIYNDPDGVAAAVEKLRRAARDPRRLRPGPEKGGDGEDDGDHGGADG